MVPYKNLSTISRVKIDITRDFWKWASKTGLKKEAWKYWETLDSYKAACGLCHVNERCCEASLCILYTPLLQKCGYWSRWSSKVVGSKEKKMYAKIIWYLIERYIKGKEIKTIYDNRS